MELKSAIEIAGGVPVVATACEVSRSAVHKWMTQGRMPLSDIGGRTAHAETIVRLINEKNIPGAHVIPEDICPGFNLYREQPEAEAA